MHLYRMNRSFAVLGLLGLFFSSSVAESSGSYNDLYNSIHEEELINQRSFDDNNTMISVGLIPFIAGAALCCGLIALLVIPFLIPMGDYDDLTGYGSSSSSGGGESTYSSYARSFSPNGIDWETFTILDWIAVAEETWKKFDPGNLDCQKRLICEVHQNAKKFGFIAKKIVDVFSYLEYAELLRLPEELKAIIDEYIDAADRGRTMKKECSDIYSNCNFSVKKMLDRISHTNEI